MALFMYLNAPSARERGRERERERERGVGRQGREAGEAEMRWMHEWDNIS